MPPILSIIIPTYEEERVIEKTLLHLRTVKSVPFELIVADSGSTDRTVEIAEKYADAVVRYDDRPKNAARGRNLGAVHASGKYLAFIDADVLPVDPEHFFKKLIERFEADSRIMGGGVCVRTLPEIETWGDRISHIMINVMTATANNIFHQGAISGEFQMMRKDAFEKVGHYNESLNITEDNDLYGRLAKLGKTRTFWDLMVMHPSRRAHKIGWPRLWFEWTINLFAVKFLGHTWHSEWLHVR
jgi:glycosyltransferase involved in cell wall biosynthesis